MGTIKSSLVQPSVVENELARLELRKEKNKNEKVLDELAEALARWKTLKATKAGQVLIEVADYEIRQYEENLSKPITQLLHLGGADVIKEVRAEWRGCCRD